MTEEGFQLRRSTARGPGDPPAIDQCQLLQKPLDGHQAEGVTERRPLWWIAEILVLRVLRVLPPAC